MRCIQDQEVKQVLDMSNAPDMVRDIAQGPGIKKFKVKRVQAKLMENGRL